MSKVTRTEWERLKQSAGSKMRYAINKGLIKKITKDDKCHYCGGKAIGWDHRDYRKPLVVNPVCRSCNRTLPRALPEFVNDYESSTSIRASAQGDDDGLGVFFGEFVGSIDMRLIEEHLEFCSWFPRESFHAENGQFDCHDGTIITKQGSHTRENKYYLSELYGVKRPFY